jgi:hypothetical protein
MAQATELQSSTSQLEEDGYLLLAAIRESGRRQLVVKQALGSLKRIDEFHIQHGHDKGVLEDRDKALLGEFNGRENLILYRAVRAKGFFGRSLTVSYLPFTPSIHRDRQGRPSTYARFLADFEINPLAARTDLAVQPGFVATGKLSQLGLPVETGSLILEDCVAGYRGNEMAYGDAIVTDLFKIDSTVPFGKRGTLIPHVQLEFND